MDNRGKLERRGGGYDQYITEWAGVPQVAHLVPGFPALGILSWENNSRLGKLPMVLQEGFFGGHSL